METPLDQNLIPEENAEEIVNDESLEELASKRDLQIKGKRKFFNKVRFVVIILILVTVGVTTTYIIAQRKRSTAPTKPIVIEEQEPVVEDINSTWELYRDDNIKVFVTIPPEAQLFVAGDNSKLEIIYSKDHEDFSNLTEKDINSGYIFRITPLALGTRDLDKVAQVKKESYRLQCPETAHITDAVETLIDTIDARYFEVFNCNGDLKVTYVPRFGIFYELVQIYKGDIGIKQQYKAKTEELLQTFRFFPEDSPSPYNPYITYFDETYNFSFKYPDNMDSTCCDMQGPATSNNTNAAITAKELVTAVNRETYVDKSNFEGFAVFLDEIGKADFKDFGTYFNNQKNRLVEDYQVVKGTAPTVTESTISVGSLTGTILKGYHWQGSDLIYIPLGTGTRSPSALVIAIKNISGEAFEEITDKILQSFEFY